jgi:hypothetical protein
VDKGHCWKSEERVEIQVRVKQIETLEKPHLTELENEFHSKRRIVKSFNLHSSQITLPAEDRISVAVWSNYFPINSFINTKQLAFNSTKKSFKIKQNKKK